ncbi:regulatory protein RecX [Flavobacterium magnum]|nr:regulatory protein RecX [Flavobacterium magnum]
MYNNPALSDAIKKLERFCAYQERCHQEVAEKLRSFTLSADEKGEVVVHLIQNDFLNEERFARSFARGKHRIKGWGFQRIHNELKMRGISAFNIKEALQEIPEEEYAGTFEKLAEKQWQSISEKNTLKKRRKFCDYFLRRGFESDLVYAKAKQLESAAR